MSDVKLSALPEEYEVMFNDTIKDIKEIVIKIRGKIFLFKTLLY